MSKAIYRQTLDVKQATHFIPVGDGTVVHALEGVHAKGHIDIWFLVDAPSGTLELNRLHEFKILMTGQKFPDNFEYVTTVIMYKSYEVHILRKV